MPDQTELFDVAWEGRERFRAFAAFESAREAAGSGKCLAALNYFADGVRSEGRKEMAEARAVRERLPTEPSLQYHLALDAILSRCLVRR